MSRKKRRVTKVSALSQATAANRPASTNAAANNSTRAANSKPAAAPEAALASAEVETPSPLLAEVQSFLSRRDELARKLADEIAATEAKLAELKRTAAQFFPEKRADGAAPKDRKAKKLIKARPLPSKSSATPAGEAPAEVIPTAGADGEAGASSGEANRP